MIDLKRIFIHIFLTGGLVSLLFGCSSAKVEDKKESDTASVSVSYHANNDIAMTVSSIADALQIGEPLDTAEYNFEGVLTDGEGRALYTDIQGAPGVWEVEVISPSKAVVRNLFLGDLLPDYLESYLKESLNLKAEDIVPCTMLDDDDEASMVVYALKGGYLRLETRAAVAPNGLEGPLMSIIASKEMPE